MINKILTTLLILLISLFSFSLFKNIQYPLLWNDEAETALLAKVIMKFGYPKIHDGKNVIYAAQILNNKLITNEMDAYLETDWLKYYFSLPFVLVTKYIQDVYTVTGILRIPHAVIGLFGLVIMCLSVIKIFKTKIQILLFAVLFILLELLSVSLVLHLREMRYYSLMIFITACLFYVYFKFHVFHKMQYWKYVALLIIISLLMLFTYRPAFFIFIIFFSLHVCVLLYFKISKKQKLQFPSLLSADILYTSLRLFFPVVVLTILSIPYLIFFKVFRFTSEMSVYFRFDYSLYLNHVVHILNYFWHFEMLPLAFFLKVIITSFWLSKNVRRKGANFLNKMHISFLLSFFFLIYALLLARVPYFMFTRYFIVLQPILTIIIVLDIFIVWYFISIVPSSYKKPRKLSLIIIIAIFVIMNIFNNKSSLLGHFYELTHQYKGPLDFIIPYIKEHYKNPENLVIATNYEEFSCMFYLGSKVTIGYVWNNIEEDIKIQPDIIIFRNGWNSNPKVFNYFLQKEKYRQVSFPVYNYPLNNIPDFNFTFPHLFQTKMAKSENENLIIFVKDGVKN